MKAALLTSVARLSAAQRKLLAGGLFIVAACATAAMLRTPLTALQNVRTERLSFEQALATEATLKQVSLQLNEDLAKLASEAGLMQEKRTESQMVVNVISELNRLGTQARITLHSITPGAPRRMAMFDELPFDVDLAGEYRDLVKWMVAAEQALPTLAISSVEARRDEASGLILMRLQMAVYRDISE